MNQFKQNLWVVVILFTSLSSSVALSYAITPVLEIKPKQTEKAVEVDTNKKNLNPSLTILLPQVVI